MNKVILIGRLVRDPSLKYSAERKAVCKFCIAVDKPYKADRGENEASADFIPCAAFGGKGETIAKYFKKGNKIAIQGRLNTSSYMKNDEKRHSFDIIVDDFDFCESKNNSDTSVQGFHQDGTQDNADDLPF